MLTPCSNLSLWQSSGPFITSHTSSRGFGGPESPEHHRCAYKRTGHFSQVHLSKYLFCSCCSATPNILGGAGNLSLSPRGLLQECLSESTFVWRTDKALDHFSKTQGVSPIFFLFLPCSKRTSHSYLVGMPPKSYPLVSLRISPSPVPSLLLGDKPHSLVPNDRKVQG